MRLVSVLLVVLVGCGASLREKADDAMKRRDYRKAAELYDQALGKQPNDPGLLAKRTEARHGVLGQLFVANQAARRVGDRPKAPRSRRCSTSATRGRCRSTSYSEQVPYTETETSNETCQRCDGTDRRCEQHSCPKTVTVTKYRTEWRTRTVTKHRTAWRTVTNPVTRYRTVTHPYAYRATEITGSYATQLALAIDDTAELSGVVASTRLAEAQAGIEHDVTFAPANVYPSRANLPSREEVLDGQRRELQRQLVAALDARYATLHCAAATYDREAAATCVYLDHQAAPPAVHATLRTRFGADEAFLGSASRTAHGRQKSAKTRCQVSGDRGTTCALRTGDTRETCT